MGLVHTLKRPAVAVLTTALLLGSSLSRVQADGTWFHLNYEDIKSVYEDGHKKIKDRVSGKSTLDLHWKTLERDYYWDKNAKQLKTRNGNVPVYEIFVDEHGVPSTMVPLAQAGQNSIFYNNNGLSFQFAVPAGQMSPAELEKQILMQLQAQGYSVGKNGQIKDASGRVVFDQNGNPLTVSSIAFSMMNPNGTPGVIGGGGMVVPAGGRPGVVGGGSHYGGGTPGVIGGGSHYGTMGGQAGVIGVGGPMSDHDARMAAIMAAAFGNGSMSINGSFGGPMMPNASVNYAAFGNNNPMVAFLMQNGITNPDQINAIMNAIASGRSPQELMAMFPGLVTPQLAQGLSNISIQFSGAPQGGPDFRFQGPQMAPGAPGFAFNGMPAMPGMVGPGGAGNGGSVTYGPGAAPAISYGSGIAPGGAISYGPGSFAGAPSWTGPGSATGLPSWTAPYGGGASSYGPHQGHGGAIVPAGMTSSASSSGMLIRGPKEIGGKSYLQVQMPDGTLVYFELSDDKQMAFKDGKKVFEFKDGKWQSLDGAAIANNGPAQGGGATVTGPTYRPQDSQQILSQILRDTRVDPALIPILVGGQARGNWIALYGVDQNGMGVMKALKNPAPMGAGEYDRVRENLDLQH